MKLDRDCVKDVLLFLEQNLQNGKPMHLNTIATADNLKKYDRDTISNTLSLLLDEGYIKGNSAPSLGFGMLDFRVDAVSLSGYEYLKNIK